MSSNYTIPDIGAKYVIVKTGDNKEICRHKNSRQ
jgi:hypothetical protein